MQNYNIGNMSVYEYAENPDLYKRYVKDQDLVRLFKTLKTHDYSTDLLILSYSNCKCDYK